MLAEDMVALASLAGQTVVTAAATDAWEATKRAMARVLGHDDPKDEELAERRLEQTRQQLAVLKGADLEQERSVLAAQWTTRFADLLDTDPSVAADLRILVQRIQKELSPVLVSAGAGVIHGSAAPPELTDLNPSADAAEPRLEDVLGPEAGMAGPERILDAGYQRSVITSQPVRLAPRPQFLVGREQLLAELHDRLARSDEPGPRIVALSGSGAGMTSVAVEYAYRHLAEVGLAWQFPAEDPAVLAGGFGELAAHLGTLDLANTRDPVASVHTVLAKYPSRWLLIFDSAQDIASVAAFLPKAGPGKVLITSRNPEWPVEALKVPGVDATAAAGFLITRTGNPDRFAAEALTDELGGQPLALEQAAAYMQATGESLASYLALFRQRRADPPIRAESAGYDTTVATTCALAFGHLQEAAPAAVDLLRLLAFCAPAAIPLSLLLQPRPGLPDRLGPGVAPVLRSLLEDPLMASYCVATLVRYSLVTQASGGSVSVHRLVQAITKGQLTPELTEQWRSATAAVVEAAIPPDPRKPSGWPDYAALLPHAQAVVSPETDGMLKIASYLGYSGAFRAARDLYRTVHRSREQRYGAENRSTLAARNNLARWTGEAGDPAEARDQFAAMVPVMDRVVGPEDLYSLVARGNLARWTGRAGDPVGARDQYAALLPVRERVLGPEHPYSLVARGNLARWTGEAGDPAGARDQYAALLPVRERVLGGPEHPDILSTRHNLARWTGEAGDPAGARDRYAALLPDSERILGREHPYSLADRHNLARWTGEAGDPRGARDEVAALLPVIERVVGPEHSYSLAARGQLARWTGQAGDPGGARDQFAELLPVIERVLRPQHPDSLAARGALARWTGRAGNPGGARDQFAELLPVIERILGPEHPDSLAARGGLAHWTLEAGDPGGARDQFAELLPVIERILGPEHPDSPAARNSLAHWTRGVAW